MPAQKIKIDFWFDEEGFWREFPKRLALRSANEFDDIAEDTIREFIHVGEPKEWPDILTWNGEY